MIKNLVETTTGNLLSEVQGMLYDGYRFVTATCVDNNDGSFDVFYHFDKDLELKNLKIKVSKRGRGSKYYKNIFMRFISGK